MFTNRKMNLFLTSSLAVALIVVLALAVAPSAAAPTIITDAYMDFAQRHPSLEKTIGSDWYERQKELGNLSVAKEVGLNWPPRPDFSILSHKAIVPVTGNQAASDYYERHPELGARAKIMADTSDYAFRHPDLFEKTNAVDTSDYYLRHR